MSPSSCIRNRWSMLEETPRGTCLGVFTVQHHEARCIMFDSLRIRQRCRSDSIIPTKALCDRQVEPGMSCRVSNCLRNSIASPSHLISEMRSLQCMLQDQSASGTGNKPDVRTSTASMLAPPLFYQKAQSLKFGRVAPPILSQRKYNDFRA
jgi:hypothetical protein